MTYRILTGDVIEQLATLPAQSVHCVVTSPPYYGLRDYGVDGQIGLESSPAEYVERLVEVFRAVWRVLRDDGTLWLNLGDSYANDGKWGGTTSGKHVNGLHGEPVGRGRRDTGLKPKDLIGVPWRVVFALQDDGWYFRQRIAWCKKAPMPESVQDRPTSAVEDIFLLTKRAQYFYDAVAVAEVADKGAAGSTFTGGKTGVNGHGRVSQAERTETGSRNMRNFWLLGPDPYPDAHFATYPREIPRRAILAGTSARGCCPVCGAPWVRVVERKFDGEYNTREAEKQRIRANTMSGGTERVTLNRTDSVSKTTVAWRPSCNCDVVYAVPCTVLDPFLGSGTTIAVAQALGRDGIGVELNPAYVELAHKRIGKAQPALWGIEDHVVA